MGKNQHIGVQFLDALPDDGERRLMLAVLIDAIRVVTQHRPAARLRAQRNWLRDRAWLQSDDHLQSFSFVNICTALGFDADYVRNSVLHMPRRDRPLRLHRWAAKVEESWNRHRRPFARLSNSAAPTCAPAASSYSIS